MDRYSIINSKNPREIVLLKGKPCAWGKCAFCDYIADNSISNIECDRENAEPLSRITGKYKALEVINSGSVFELFDSTLREIKRIVDEKGIELLYFESHYSYRNRLDEMRDYFGVPIIYKCGIETFDDYFRNKVLKKGIVYDSIDEIKQYFQSICLMVGIQGQTKEMIARDMEILRTNFEYGCVNVYCNNTTSIKQDNELIQWFLETYKDWGDYPHIDVLVHNTDFGVGD